MHDALRRLCTAAHLNPSGATLLRGQTNAVVLLPVESVVLKIARKGTPAHRVGQTVALVKWLALNNIPTVALHPVPQPVVAEPYVGSVYTYLPQPVEQVPTASLAGPLRSLHHLGYPPVSLPQLDAVTAIHHSLSSAPTLAPTDHRFLSKRIEQLADEVRDLPYSLPPTVLHGDPQHGNALYDDADVVLSDWDSAVVGPREWDLVTVEIHVRRFGHGIISYTDFAEKYGCDVRAWAGYQVLSDLRELRMITTNARKSAREPDKMAELARRIDGLRQQDHTRLWNIM
ncbi:phosphotransferase family protein [Streptacidiphilus sp. MAP12-20]|uniref:phosphotransferase family protein n=1 Tax=Streptacidiphilus sp. MAP12-20 TaxID=3156299 RepID=UPI003518DBA7